MTAYFVGDLHETKERKATFLFIINFYLWSVTFVFLRVVLFKFREMQLYLDLLLGRTTFCTVLPSSPITNKIAWHFSFYVLFFMFPYTFSISQSNVPLQSWRSSEWLVGFNFNAMIFVCYFILFDFILIIVA